MTTILPRKRFLQYGAAGGVALFLPLTARAPAATVATPGRLTKYLEPFPVPGDGIVVAAQSGPNHYAFTRTAISKQLHPDLPATPIWAYDDGSGLGGQAGSFGMAVAAESGTPLTIDFTHGLPDKVRLMTHLHGGFVEAASDGNPSVSDARAAPRRGARQRARDG